MVFDGFVGCLFLGVGVDVVLGDMFEKFVFKRFVRCIFLKYEYNFFGFMMVNEINFYF